MFKCVSHSIFLYRWISKYSIDNKQLVQAQLLLAVEICAIERQEYKMNFL